MNYIDLLKKSFLFTDVDNEVIEGLINKHPPSHFTFKRGDEIFSSKDEAIVGFILSGECEVRHAKQCGKNAVLNILTEGDSFGILSIYSEEQFPTQIFALRNSEIIFFSKKQIQHFVNSDLHISSNLINFLVNRINFLNKKIAMFSGTRVEDRLSSFLLTKMELYGKTTFPFNRQKTADEINAGRASVYRALASLEADGIISFDNKNIIINDLNGLERIKK